MAAVTTVMVTMVVMETSAVMRAVGICENTIVVGASDSLGSY